MTTENLDNKTESTAQSVDAENKSEVTQTAEQILEENKALKASFQEAITTRDKAKQRARELEVTAGSAAELQKKLDEITKQFETTNTEYSTLKENIKQQAVNSTLTTALEAAGAKAVTTVMKLIDKTKLQFDEQGQINADSVVAAIEEVRNSDPILFGNPTDPKDAATDVQIGSHTSNPDVRRAGNASTDGAFEKELAAAMSHKAIEAVMRKYGKMQ